MKNPKLLIGGLAACMVLAASIGATGCQQPVEDDVESGDNAFSQSQVDGDPTLQALQAAAANVNQYEISVAGIDTPVPSASVGTSVNGFGTSGLDWFQNPAVPYAENKQWDKGTPTGKKCQWAAVFRFHAIFSDPPAEAIAMKNLPGGRWGGRFWSWTDDHASTGRNAAPTKSYAWSSGLWKWIGASGANDKCLIPTKTMVARMMVACKSHAEANGGDPKGCRMPSYDPALEPSDTGTSAEGGVSEGGSSEGGSSEGGRSDAGAADGG